MCACPSLSRRYSITLTLCFDSDTLSVCHHSPLRRPRTNRLNPLDASRLAASSHLVNQWIHMELVSAGPDTVWHSTFWRARKDMGTTRITAEAKQRDRRLFRPRSYRKCNEKSHCRPTEAATIETNESLWWSESREESVAWRRSQTFICIVVKLWVWWINSEAVHFLNH